MSWEATAWAWEQDCGRAEFLILLCLANYANEDALAYPSHATLAKKARCGESTVRRALDALEAAGLIRREKRITSKGQTSNGYVLLLRPKATASRVSKTNTPPVQNGHPWVSKMDTEPSNLEPSKYFIPVVPSASSASEPRLTARADDMPKHVKPVKDWGQAIAGLRDDPIRLDGERIVLSAATRATWLERFDGNAECLDLALIEARGCVQPNARAHPLAVQVEKQLARIVRDKRDRDARYAKAAGSRKGSSAPGKRTVSDVLRERREAAAAAGGTS